MKPLGVKKFPGSTSTWNPVREHREALRHKGRARSKRAAKKEIKKYSEAFNVIWSPWVITNGEEWDYEKAVHRIELLTGQVVETWPNAGQFSSLEEPGKYYQFHEIKRYQIEEDP